MDYMYEYYDKILSCYVLFVTRRNNVKLRYLLVQKSKAYDITWICFQTIFFLACFKDFSTPCGKGRPVLFNVGGFSLFLMMLKDKHTGELEPLAPRLLSDLSKNKCGILNVVWKCLLGTLEHHGSAGHLKLQKLGEHRKQLMNFTSVQLRLFRCHPTVLNTCCIATI